MKKLIFSILSILLLFFTFTLPISADMGPKPSVTINFKGFDEPYYVTLLSSVESYGPNSVSEDDAYLDYEQSDLLIKFNQYEDDYYFYGVIDECSDDHEFKWGYWPPETFKILIYFPNSDTFIVSDICERYAFNSYYTVEIDNNKIIDVYKSYNYTNEILSFCFRLIFTIIMELIIAEIFNLKEKKQKQIILVTNLVTQVLLNLYISYVIYTNGYFLYVLYYLWLEILIFIVEGFVYKLTLKTNKINVWKYAFIANVSSFILGLLIASIYNSYANMFNMIF